MSRVSWRYSRSGQGQVLTSAHRAHFQHVLIWSINFSLYPIQPACCCQKCLPEITLGSHSLLKNSSGFSVLQKKPKPFTSRSLTARTPTASSTHIAHDLFTTACSPSSLPLYACLPLCRKRFNLPLINSHSFFLSDLKCFLFCDSLLSTLIWSSLLWTRPAVLSWPPKLLMLYTVGVKAVYINFSDGLPMWKAPGSCRWPSCSTLQ